MDDHIDTTWPIKPHTRAKHQILTAYLKAWAPIVTRSAGQLPASQRPERALFIDGFAGPGEYSGGELGSPLLVIDELVAHEASFPVPVRCVFVEKRPDRRSHLNAVLASRSAEVKASPNVEIAPITEGDCESVVRSALDVYDSRHTPFGPALTFLDQFGYGAVSMDLIRRLLAHRSSEVLAYLNYRDMNRFLDDESKDSARDSTFGTPVWRNARTSNARERSRFLLGLYRRQLREAAGATYVWDFAMADDNGNLLYWLFFATNHDRGLEVMKRAMWSVDSSGCFGFSDAQDPDQLTMFGSYDDDHLVAALTSKFKGKRASVREIRDWVLVSTPHYKYANVMKRIGREGGFSARSKERIAFSRSDDSDEWVEFA